MIMLLVVVLLVAVILGILGVTVHGLSYLLIIGIVVFLVDLVVFGVHLGRGHGKRPAR